MARQHSSAASQLGGAVGYREMVHHLITRMMISGGVAWQEEQGEEAARRHEQVRAFIESLCMQLPGHGDSIADTSRRAPCCASAARSWRRPGRRWGGCRRR
jgi:hypothetical protein